MVEQKQVKQIKLKKLKGKKMKTIKIILLLTTISLFTSVPYGVAEARDCSNPKGFHAKMMCKFTGSSGSSVTAAEPNATEPADHVPLRASQAV